MRKLKDFERNGKNLGVDIGQMDPIPFETSGCRALQDYLGHDRASMRDAGACFYDLNVILNAIKEIRIECTHLRVASSRSEGVRNCLSDHS